MGVPTRNRYEEFEICGEACPIDRSTRESIKQEASIGVELAIENEGHWPDMYPGPKSEEAFVRAASCIGKSCLEKIVARGRYRL